MRTGRSLLAHWDPDAGDNSHDANLRKAERLLAQLPVCWPRRHRLRRAKNRSRPTSIVAGRQFAVDAAARGSRPSGTKAMEISLILYAEHEFNASTFTARVVASTLSDLHSAITAAIGALKGPLHGGANEQVMEVLQEVGTSDKAEAWVREALGRKARIMGFGHRVYKTGDPRAKYLKPLCRELAAETGGRGFGENGRHHRTDRRRKSICRRTSIGRAPGCITIWACRSIFTRRCSSSAAWSGWSAHVIEQLDNNRLIRPRARYIGHAARTYVPMEKR